MELRITKHWYFNFIWNIFLCILQFAGMFFLWFTNDLQTHLLEKRNTLGFKGENTQLDAYLISFGNSNGRRSFEFWCAAVSPFTNSRRHVLFYIFLCFSLENKAVMLCIFNVFLSAERHLLEWLSGGFFSHNFVVARHIIKGQDSLHRREEQSMLFIEASILIY